MQYMWTGFAIYFFGLAIYHFRKAFQKIDPFKNKGTVKAINGMNVGVVDFVGDFNGYLEKVNKENKTNNLIAGFGDILAGVAAIISICAS